MPLQARAQAQPTGRPVNSAKQEEMIFLAGLPPLNEFVGFIESRALQGQPSARRQLADQWRAANDHIQQLQQLEAGLADSAPTSPLSSSLDARAEALLNDPAIVSDYSIVPVELALVELDRLVVYQKFINVAYVRRLRRLLAAEPTAEQLFDFALPLDGRYDVQPAGNQVAQNGWAFTSPSTDFRVLGQQLIDPRSIAGLSVPGRPTAVVAVAVGYGSNVLSAIRVNGRLILNNGSHRAYALRAAGHERVPCLIQNISRPEELQAIASPELAQRLDLYLGTPRPPLLKDYFDQRLRLKMKAPRLGRQIQIALQAQPTDLPMP
jgi:hypothetical protein